MNSRSFENFIEMILISMVSVFPLNLKRLKVFHSNIVALLVLCYDMCYAGEFSKSSKSCTWKLTTHYHVCVCFFDTWNLTIHYVSMSFGLTQVKWNDNYLWHSIFRKFSGFNVVRTIFNLVLIFTLLGSDGSSFNNSVADQQVGLFFF